MKPKSVFGMIVLLMYIGGGSAHTESGEKAASIDAMIQRIQTTAYKARIHPTARKNALQTIAEDLQTLSTEDPKTVMVRQHEIQDALLQFCDEDVIFALERDWVEPLDEVLESLFSLEDIRSGYAWNPLAYVYGYVNHDVSLEAIQTVRNQWDEMPEAGRLRQYPTLIHVIDAVLKPLAYWEMDDPVEMNQALDIALPFLHELLLQEPKPGRAFHAPSHALLILGAMYNRWTEDTPYASKLKVHIGSRENLGLLLMDQLTGSHPDPDQIAADIYPFFETRDYYLANTFARLNLRLEGKTVSVLERSLEYFQQQGGREKTIHGIQRSLAALNHEETRTAFRRNRHKHRDDFVWLIRNGRAETVVFAQQELARLLNCEVDKALEIHYKESIRKIQESR